MKWILLICLIFTGCVSPQVVSVPEKQLKQPKKPYWAKDPEMFSTIKKMVKKETQEQLVWENSLGQ